MDEHEPERRGLAYRRHQQGRSRGRARRLVHDIWGIPANPGNPWDHEPELVEALVRRLSVDRVVWLNNYRGERLDEQRAALNEKDQREDLT